ncbi:MAG: hypothetical protein JWP95_1568, partial [Actinotalea sp.]|nr:hypothetical protein [Actinotalea sp.]
MRLDVREVFPDGSAGDGGDDGTFATLMHPVFTALNAPPAGHPVVAH